ncbi:MAG: hypothetical protein ACO1NX_07015 [Chitinophagaceae bacterium]
MQLYNVFDEVHLALQDALFIGALSIGKADAALSQFQQLKEIAEDSQQLLHAIESTVLPAVDLFEPAVADALLQQHRLAATEAQRLLEALAQNAQTLQVGYNRFMCAQLHCMRKCETSSDLDKRE